MFKLCSVGSARPWLLCLLLLAIQLAVANLAARSTVLLPLIWVVAAGPGIARAVMLFRRSSLAWAPRRRLVSRQA